jgi:hypothetical protein
MLRAILATILALAAAMPVSAQARYTQPGDSVSIIVHRVKADSRSQYDSLMQRVWAPAALRAGEKYPAYAKAFAQRRRYVPTEMAGDSTYPYLYVYPTRPEVPPSPSGGNNVLRAAGLTKAQSDSFASALRRFTVSGTSATLVDEPYGSQ